MCGSFLRLQHDWLSGNSRILHFRTGGTGKEERRRRSVLAGAAGAHNGNLAAADETNAGSHESEKPPTHAASHRPAIPRRKPIFAPVSARDEGDRLS